LPELVPRQTERRRGQNLRPVQPPTVQECAVYLSLLSQPCKNAAGKLNIKMLLLVLSAVLLAVLALVFLRRKQAGPAEPQHVPSPVQPPQDEDDVQRREVDEATMRAARATVTSMVPDAVLADALQHTDAQGLAQAFANVDPSVLADAIGDAPQTVQASHPEDLRQLSGAGQAVEELDIWSFGES